MGLKMLRFPYNEEDLKNAEILGTAAREIGEVIELARGLRQVLGLDELTNLLIKHGINPKDIENL